MEDKPRVRPGLSSPDQSQDVEFAIDKQIDEGQQEQDEKESRGPLGPPRMDKRYKSNRHQIDDDEQPATSDRKKQHRFADGDRRDHRSVASALSELGALSQCKVDIKRSAS